MILELCKGVHCVDLDDSFQTHIYLQNLASTQPRTSPVKFPALSIPPATCSSGQMDPRALAEGCRNVSHISPSLRERGALFDTEIALFFLSEVVF